jgi:hypothetical protein
LTNTCFFLASKTSNMTTSVFYKNAGRPQSERQYRLPFYLHYEFKFLIIAVPVLPVEDCIEHSAE